MFKSVAPSLIRAGVPAVVANQFSVYVDAMKAFDFDFYSSLARGESISAAVADGRKAMAPHRGQFFLPTLYMRVADGEGYLFSGEPETHRQWRSDQMQMVAAWWWAMTELQRAIYIEGILREGGREIQPLPPPIPDTRPQRGPQVEEQPSPDHQEKRTDREDRPKAEMPNLSGTYEVYGWWNPWFDQEAAAGRALTRPKRYTVAHSGTSITITAVPSPTNDKLAFSGTMNEQSLSYLNEVGWEAWHEFGWSVYVQGPWSNQWMEAYWTGQTNAWRPQTATWEDGVVGFTRLSDEYWNQILEGLRSTPFDLHELKMPASVGRPVVVTGVGGLMYVRV